MNTTQKIKELIQLKKLLHEKVYVEYCIANPGYIMHNDGIRVETLNKLLKQIENIEYAGEIISIIKEKRNYCYFKHNNTKGVNGFYTNYQLYNELITLLEPVANAWMTNFGKK